MLSTHHPHQEFETALLQRLASSERFNVYQEAFQTATGLPLRLISSDPEGWCLDGNRGDRSPFCEALNLCKKACDACRDMDRLLMEEAEVEGPTTCHCFAGLCATAIPVKLGASVIGFLKTGQVFNQVPNVEQFESLLNLIGRKTLDEKAHAILRNAYLETQHVEPIRYQSMVTLLENFAEQLSEQATSLAIADEGCEPAAIAKARKFIHEHLDQPLSLGQVARHAGLSESHFCRLFKDAAGVTLTDYVNRCRIGWAKRELLRPDARISEIAFLVGYQSLSQFNRSFVRIVGSSPSSYRRERVTRVAS
jgi:AraC-like DNA-binding protein/ligand-binding sensor protein